MSRFIAWSLVAVTLGLATGPTYAQERRPSFDSDEAGPIQFLLRHPQELRFTAEQKTALEGLDRKLKEENQPLLEKLRALRPARAEDGSAPPQRDREAMRQRRDEARPLLQQMRDNTEKATRVALERLNPEQKKVAENLLKERRKAMESRRRGPPGRRMSARTM
ncbi:MAG: hypothetical protein HY561_08060 [Gemmatimonadetes bacterium]|nr:hypothetical protein [Gemmatimonadota bacterium]